MTYYNNSPLVRGLDRYSFSEVKVLTQDEVNGLVQDKKVTPIAEIKYEKNSGRISRPKHWMQYIL